MTTLTYIAASLLCIGWVVPIAMVCLDDSKPNSKNKNPFNQTSEDILH